MRPKNRAFEDFHGPKSAANRPEESRWMDRDFVLSMVAKHGGWLEFAAEELRNDQEVGTSLAPKIQRK